MFAFIFWISWVLVVACVMFYYRKKKRASIIKTLLMGLGSFLGYFVLVLVMFSIFGPDDSPSEPNDKAAAISNSRYGRWSIQEYVNDFKEETGEKYIIQESEIGSFSNSATTNSELIGFILIDKEDIRIQLKEYGKYYAKDEEYIRFKVKSGEEVIKMDGFINNQGYINVGKTSTSPLIPMLLKGGSIKFYGDINRGRRTYYFQISGLFLEEALKEIGVSLSGTAASIE